MAQRMTTKELLCRPAPEAAASFGRAYQISYNGGTGIGYPGTDISVSKLSSDGTNLLYSTYFGGSGNENPHSIVCNQNGELYVFGSTSSIDLPTSGSAYDNSFNSGTTFSNSVLNYVNAYRITSICIGFTMMYIAHMGSYGPMGPMGMLTTACLSSRMHTFTTEGEMRGVSTRDPYIQTCS